MKPSLLVLAAGMSSRYGSLKQIEPVGPGGETIIDYSINDAIQAGFKKVVFVIRSEMATPFQQTVGSRFEQRLPVEYVFQELDKLPPKWTVPPDRKKPWGTGHAILMAAKVIRKPFAVINADDFYGANSFRLLAGHLSSNKPDHAMVGFKLRNTLSEFGTVSRGICQVSNADFLESVTEITQIERNSRAAKYTDSGGWIHLLTGNEVTSMNMWGFTPAIFEQLDQQWVAFLKERSHDNSAEFYIPSVVNTLVNLNQGRVKVLRTPDSWLGITHREDRPLVKAGLRKLVALGAYPKNLWA